MVSSEGLRLLTVQVFSIERTGGQVVVAEIPSVVLNTGAASDGAIELISKEGTVIRVIGRFAVGDIAAQMGECTVTERRTLFYGELKGGQAVVVEVPHAEIHAVGVGEKKKLLGGVKGVVVILQTKEGGIVEIFPTAEILTTLIAHLWDAGSFAEELVDAISAARDIPTPQWQPTPEGRVAQFSEHDGILQGRPTHSPPPLPPADE